MNYRTSHRSHKRGFIGTVILIVIALIILGYFHIGIQQIWQAAHVQENVRFAGNLVMEGFMNGVKSVISSITSLISKKVGIQ